MSSNFVNWTSNHGLYGENIVFPGSTSALTFSLVTVKVSAGHGAPSSVASGMAVSLERIVSSSCTATSIFLTGFTGVAVFDNLCHRFMALWDISFSNLVV